MTEIFTFIMLGLGASALIATVSLSLVLTFRASGVINFAAGANAAFVAYVFWDLRTTGQLFLGFRIPLTGDGEGLGWAPALLISLVVAAALGIAQYALVYRFLRNAGSLAKVVASSGFLLVFQSLVVLNYGADTRAMPSLLPAGGMNLGGMMISYDRLIVIILALVAAGVLTFIYQKTSFGIQTRAAANSRKGALLSGVNPAKLEGLNWVFASTLTGLIGILASPMIGLQPTAITLFVVPALSAVLLANFSSFWIAAITGVAIGAAQSVVTYTQGQSWFPNIEGIPLPGIKESMPFLLIAIVMFFKGRNLPDRLSDELPRLPRAPRPDFLVARFGVAIVLATCVILFAPFGWRQALANSLIGAILCMSIVVITGYLGQVTLGQMAIAGVAGFVMSKLGQEWGLGFPIATGLAILVATAVSLLVALPALRMRGMQLAVITLAGAVAIQNLWFSNPQWGGGSSPASVEPPSFLGVELGPGGSFYNGDGSAPSPGFVFFVLFAAVVVAALVVWIRRGTIGAKMLAVRANEAATAAAGVNVAVVKLVAFSLAGFIAAIAGTLYGYNFGLVTASRFTEFTAIAFLAMAYLGGITTVTGAVIGGLLVSQGFMMYTITTWFGVASEFQTLIGGIAVLLTVVANPDGIAGFFRDKFSRRKGEEKQAEATTSVEKVQLEPSLTGGK